MSKNLDEFPLSEFVRSPEAHVEHLRETGEPEFLTLNGSAELVVQSAPAYTALMNRMRELEAALGFLDLDQEPEDEFDGILEAAKEMERGEGVPAAVALAGLREKLGVQRDVR